MKKLKLNYITFLGFFCFSCNTNSADNVQSKKTTSTIDSSNAIPEKNNFVSHYDVKNPSSKWELPESLMEVSGNAWVDSNHLILIEDLRPNLYYLRLDEKNAVIEKTIPFTKTDKEKIDIEDVSFINDTVYALWSHGIIFKITDWKSTPKVEQLNTGLTKQNNTEGLCYDPVTKELLIACKDDAGVEDEKHSAKAVYQFNINQGKLVTPPFMIIHKKDFESITGNKLSFNPSAIAVHPITHDIYILTTRDNKGMAIFSHDGKLKSYQNFDPQLMPQPEGICFSPDGKLFISSEGKKGEHGNLFRFNYN